MLSIDLDSNLDSFDLQSKQSLKEILMSIIISREKMTQFDFYSFQSDSLKKVIAFCAFSLL
jgi:hypothetical protein